MSYAENLSLFLLLLFGIVIVPGMDMLFVITNALTGGRGRGLAATAGVMLGGAVHTLWGMLSVGVLLTFPPILMKAMVFAGAAYMAWIGYTLLRSSVTIGAVDGAGAHSHWAAFRQGAITCLLNPKAYLFVAAVYPQFVKPAYGGLVGQGFVIGAAAAMMQLSIYGSLALAAARSRELLLSSPKSTALVGRAAGALFLAVAALAFWEGGRLLAG